MVKFEKQREKFTIGFNPALCYGFVYSKCDPKVCVKPGSYNGSCEECLVKSAMINFAKLLPFEFELIMVPCLLQNMFTTVRHAGGPINSMEVIALYNASLIYFEMLSDEKSHIVDGDDQWCEEVYEQRVSFRECWFQRRQEYIDEFNSVSKEMIISTEVVPRDGLVRLFRLMEQRIIEGLAIIRFVVNDDTTKNWKSRADEWFEEQASLEVVPWTFNRCKYDRADELRAIVAFFNKQREEHRERTLKLKAIRKEVQEAIVSQVPSQVDVPQVDVPQVEEEKYGEDVEEQALKYLKCLNLDDRPFVIE